MVFYRKTLEVGIYEILEVDNDVTVLYFKDGVRRTFNSQWMVQVQLRKVNNPVGQLVDAVRRRVLQLVEDHVGNIRLFHLLDPWEFTLDELDDPGSFLHDPYLLSYKLSGHQLLIRDLLFFLA